MKVPGSSLYVPHRWVTAEGSEGNVCCASTKAVCPRTGAPTEEGLLLCSTCGKALRVCYVRKSCRPWAPGQPDLAVRASYTSWHLACGLFVSGQRRQGNLAAASHRLPPPPETCLHRLCEQWPDLESMKGKPLGLCATGSEWQGTRCLQSDLVNVLSGGPPSWTLQNGGGHRRLDACWGQVPCGAKQVCSPLPWTSRGPETAAKTRHVHHPAHTRRSAEESVLD